MSASQTSKKDVVSQNNNISDSVLGMKAASRVRNDYGLYTKQLENSDGIRDSLD